MTGNVYFCMPPVLTTLLEKHLVADEIGLLMAMFAAEATNESITTSLPFPEIGQLLSHSAFYFEVQIKKITPHTVWVNVQRTAFLNPDIGEWEQVH
jgi:hypothetical protein